MKRHGFILAIGAILLLPVWASAQTNSPLDFKDIPRDGEPYNVKKDRNTKRHVVRCKDWVRHTDDFDTLLVVKAFVLELKDGKKRREIMIQILHYPKGDKATENACFIPYLACQGLANDLFDARRIGKYWRDEMGDPETTDKAFGSVENVRIKIERIVAIQTEVAVTITVQERGRYKPLNYRFNSLADFSKFVDTFNSFHDWLETQ